MWTVEGELEEAFAKLNLSKKEISKCSLIESKRIQNNAMRLYVNGNPRAWWQDLKKKPIAFDYDFPSEHISNHIPDEKDESRVWWIPETEQEELVVYDVDPKIISKIMEETASFEYYVLGKDLSWLIIETDHCQLWLVKD